MNARRCLVAVTMVVALCGLALAQDNDNSARQHGYRHGYVDGYHHGQGDQQERESYEFRSEDYARADRGYDPAMGGREDFQDAYRKGYRDGYDDGYYSRQARFGPDDDYRGSWNRNRDRGWDGARNRGNGDGGYDRYGNQRIPEIPRDPTWRSMDPQAIGYRDGIEVGLHDWLNKASYNPHDNHIYRDANNWYGQATTHRDFKRQYRQGFDRGYKEAFQNERWHRMGGNDSFGTGFRRGVYFGFWDSNRGRASNPQRLSELKQGDAQYQDGFLQGYGWVYRLRGPR